MKKIKFGQIGYDFLKEKIKLNKSLRNLTNDDIDVIIFNHLKALAEERKWIKDIPASMLYHK